MTFKYFGHSCFMVELLGKRLLFDPFIRKNERAAAVQIEDLKPDYILVSHGHQDHTDDLVYLASSTNALVICSWELMVWLQSQGIQKVHAMNVGGKFKTDFGSIQMTFAAHSSSLPDGTYAGVAAGFLVKTDGFQVYYSGDTGLCSELKFLGEMNQIDWAILPVGGNFTMDAEDAVIAAKMLNCNNVIGVHFDTFPPIEISKEEAKSHFSEAGIRFILPEINQVIELR